MRLERDSHPVAPSPFWPASAVAVRVVRHALRRWWGKIVFDAVAVIGVVLHGLVVEWQVDAVQVHDDATPKADRLIVGKGDFAPVGDFAPFGEEDFPGLAGNGSGYKLRYNGRNKLNRRSPAGANLEPTQAVLQSTAPSRLLLVSGDCRRWRYSNSSQPQPTRPCSLAVVSYRSRWSAVAAIGLASAARWRPPQPLLSPCPSRPPPALPGRRASSRRRRPVFAPAGVGGARVRAPSAYFFRDAHPRRG